ncbi:MAG: hypothetical protein MRQ09_03510 [Candidatus Midichloria sp.]|nr:hypothetical protein [Candidatus Midichloria sp.]
MSTNMFTGMSETLLVIKPYLSKLTRSELFSLITCGTTGIAGSVILLYSNIVDGVVPNSMQHILSSILIGLPAALTFSRIIVPETEVVLTEGDYMFLKKTNNTLDIVFNGLWMVQK